MPTAKQYARWKERDQRLARDIARAVEAPCSVCHTPCNGLLMRCRPRTADMLKSEVPPHPQGWGILLCQRCQRQAQLNGGFVQWLARMTYYAAVEAKHDKLRKFMIKNGRPNAYKIDAQTGNVVRKSNDEIRKMRSGGFCPFCGGVDLYVLSTRDVKKCAACHRQFSDTSQTENRARKMPEATARKIRCRFEAGANARQIMKEFGVDYNTAWRHQQKFRMSKADA